MKRLLFLLFFLTAAAAAGAQGYDMPDVVISKEKANIAGKVYYVHKVLPKQTVFSICKAYGITSEELTAANPDIKGGLKAGSIIFVPADAANIPDTAAEKPARVSIAPKPEEPAETAEPDGERVQQVERVIEHRVRWYESLSTIARKYDISEAELLDYNGLKASDPIRGRVLLIPVIGEVFEEYDDPEEIQPESRSRADRFEPEEPEAPVAPVRKARWFSASEPLHIALVLPFNTTGSGHASASFLNFYSGALMAIQDQKEKGAHLVVNVYDLAQGADAILADPRFAQSDLVIGPVEAPTLEPFVAFSDQNGIPLVSPLDHKADSLIATHPFLFQVPASSDIQMQNLVASLHARPQDRVILVAPASATESDFSGRVEACLQTAGVSYRKATNGELASLLPAGSRTAPAKVIIGSESKSFATEVIRNLNTLSKRGIPIEVWCTNRVRNYETSDPDALFNLSVHASVPYFVDYSNPQDQDFVRRYRALYYAEPDDFAFQGYDVFTFFISAMMQQGTAFSDHADLRPMQLLHCNFQFGRDNERSGWRNRATRNIVYEKQDFSISVSK